jgi:DNA-directed RNA polymerase subunit RPC12/RpoP
MDIYFMCPKCEQRLVVDAAGAGLHINCPNCTQRLIVPDPPVQRTVDVEFLPPEEADDALTGETLELTSKSPPSLPPPQKERLDKTVFIPQLGASESVASSNPPPINRRPIAPKPVEVTLTPAPKINMPSKPIPSSQPIAASITPAADVRPDQTVKITFEPPPFEPPQFRPNIAPLPSGPQFKFRKSDTPAPSRNGFWGKLARFFRFNR